MIAAIDQMHLKSRIGAERRFRLIRGVAFGPRQIRKPAAQLREHARIGVWRRKQDIEPLQFVRSYRNSSIMLFSVPNTLLIKFIARTTAPHRRSIAPMPSATS